MYIGMDIHKRYVQVAVMDDTGQVVEETPVENGSLEEFAQRHAGATVALEATSNYYHIQDTLSEYLDVCVADPEEVKLIGYSMQKSDDLDARQLARLARLDAVPECYVPSPQLTLTEEIDQLDKTIERQARSIEAVERLMTIDGVAHYSALTIYAELGDVERFDSAKQAVSYAGLDPVVRESGDSRKEGGISKQGSGHLRWVLCQCANVAVHTCGDEFLGRFYERLDKKKNSMVAMVATARKLLVSIYHMLDREEVYDPPGVSA
jgi:transposase